MTVSGWARPSILATVRAHLSSPLAVAAVVLAFYGVWLAAARAYDYDARYFVQIGRNYVLSSTASSAIRIDPHFKGYPPNNAGYDRQFSYYIAVDPANARYYVGDYAYRYTRILYPMLARYLALARTDLIPYTLILVNLLAAVGGTLVIAAWLRRRELSPWLALIFGLNPALFVSVHRDLTEPLSYALVALAIYLFDFGGSRRALWSGLAFGLAVLARESSAAFAVLYGLALFFPSAAGRDEGSGRRSRDAGIMLSLALSPIVFYKGFLQLWLGSFGPPGPRYPDWVPLDGLFSYAPLDGEAIHQLVSVVAPALLCAGLALWALLRKAWRVEVWALLANVVLFVLFLAPGSYAEFQASGRIALCVVVAALFCVPIFDRLLGRNRSWLWIGSMLWFTPWWALAPFWLGGS